MFPGNNTSIGFYSYYNHIVPRRESNRFFCLKGGPGTGKSTFMKKIASGVGDAGFDVEFFRCSSDPDSLDGIFVPALKAAVVDGTAPHIIDPISPGAVDEIINLGDYWDTRPIKDNKREIIQCGAEIKRLFKRAYKYMAAAKNIMDDITEIYDNAENRAGAYIEAQNIADAHFNNKPEGKLGKKRKLFATGVTPSGIISLADTLTDGSYKVYTVNHGFGGIVPQLLASVSYEAFIRGIDAEIYYCPMAPEERIEHVIIPSLKLAVMSNNEAFNARGGTAIELDKYKNAALIDEQKAAVDFDMLSYKMLLNAAVASLKGAKELHDVLEGYYAPHMDFEKSDRKAKEVLNAILECSARR